MPAPLRPQNPVHPGYFADPFVWKVGGEYYAVGTGVEDVGAPASTRPTAFPLLRSPDLANWQPAGHALVRGPAALGNAYWAPEIVECEGRWYLYYSVGHGDRDHHLRVAASDAPLGPYVDVGALTDPAVVPFAIDPHPFRDADGQWYLFHARDFLTRNDERGRPARVGTAVVVSPLVGMTALGASTWTVARARHDWQRFAAQREMYGAVHDWHTLEGPCVLRHDGRYFCLYSGGCWQDESYGVDYAVADSVHGPWSDEGTDAGPRVLRTLPGQLLGPGHCSVVAGPDGASLRLAYHAWSPDRAARRLCVDELVFTSDGPRSAGAGCSAQPTRGGPAAA